MDAAESERELTLPALLAAQSSTRGADVALRRKTLGLWSSRSWRQTGDEVGRIASGLLARGFGRGDRLHLAGEQGPEALVLTFAAQWLGGSVLFVEPGTAADAAFERGFSFAYPALRSARASSPAPPAVAAAPDDAAFTILTGDDRVGGVVERAITHRDVLARARTLVLVEAIGTDADVLAPLALDGEPAGVLLAAWLLAGFRLNFGEAAGTRDADRRELAPAIVVESAASYCALRERVLESLPPAGSIRRRFIDWTLAPAARGAVEPLRRAVGRWLVRRPLRKTLGLSETRQALVVGTLPHRSVTTFYADLGIVLRQMTGSGAAPPAEKAVEAGAGISQPGTEAGPRTFESARGSDCIEREAR